MKLGVETEADLKELINTTVLLICGEHLVAMLYDANKTITEKLWTTTWIDLRLEEYSGWLKQISLYPERAADGEGPDYLSAYALYISFCIEITGIFACIILTMLIAAYILFTADIIAESKCTE